MPWIVFRDAFGNTLEANQCAQNDCGTRLIEAMNLRLSKGYKTTQRDPARWEGISPGGQVESISIETGPPEFSKSDPPGP